MCITKQDPTTLLTYLHAKSVRMYYLSHCKRQYNIKGPQVRIGAYIYHSFSQIKTERRITSSLDAWDASLSQGNFKPSTV